MSDDKTDILLIGDMGKVFVDFTSATDNGCEVYSNALDGIDAAEKGGFGLIAVAVSAVPAKLGSALKALRQLRPQAKIILLAQMYEEPIAKEVCSDVFSGPKLTDDYLICPTRFADLKQRAFGTAKADPLLDVERDKDVRIRLLEELATTDELTGLKNRRYILEFARQIIERAGEEDGQVTLLMFDIDDFKHYNDVYGHAAGDDILKEAAVLMKASCRTHDVVGRIGGDEFAVIFWDDPNKIKRRQTERRHLAVEHPREAIFIAKRFRSELKKAELSMLGPEGKGVLAISGGLATFPRDGSTIQQLLAQADKALLEAKRSGKNRIYLVGKAQNDISNIS